MFHTLYIIKWIDDDPNVSIKVLCHEVSISRLDPRSDQFRKGTFLSCLGVM